MSRNTKVTNRSLACLLSAIVVIPALHGCDQVLSSKYDAEESGYLVHFRTAFSATCKVGTTEQVQTGAYPIETQCGSPASPMTCTAYMPIYTTVSINSLKAAKINAVDAVAKIEQTLPPPELTTAHALLTRALNADVIGDPSLLEHTSRACKGFTEFEKAVTARTVSRKTTDSLFITYKPPSPPGTPGVPGIKYDTRSGLGFAVDQSYTLPTPYGNVTVGYKSAPGIKMLRIVSEKKQRFLTLDRPFELLIPKGYSTRVAYEGSDELILYVSKV